MKNRILTLAMAGMVCVVANAVSLRADPSPVVQGNAMFRAGEVEDYANFGIKFMGPKGWGRVAEGAVNRVARWVKNDDAGKAVALMQIEHNKFGGSLEQEILAINKSMTLKSLRNITVDGEPGIWAQGLQQKNDAQLFVAVRGRVKYVTTIIRPKVSGSDAFAADDAEVMKAFIDAWRWREIEEPYLHVNFMERPMPVLGGELHLNFPISARPDAVENPKTQIHFAMINLKTQDDEFRMRLALREGEAPTPDSLGASLKNKLPDGTKLQWEDVGGHAKISRWAKTNVVGKQLWMSLGIVPISEKHTAVVTFTLDREEEDVQRSYFDVARRVMESIGPE